MDACEWTRQIGAYHDGELSAEDVRSVEEHLRGCHACAAELERCKALSRLFAEDAFPAARPEFLDRIRRESPAAREKAVVAFAERLAAIAAAILILCAAWVWSGPTPAERLADAPSAWEWTAVTLDEEEPYSEIPLFAQWLAQDLDLEIDHD